MLDNYIPLIEFSILDTFVSICIILASVIITVGISLKYRNNYYEGLILYSWHSLWCIIFLIATQYYRFSDSAGWYVNSFKYMEFGENPKNIFDFQSYSHNHLMYLLNLSFSNIGLKFTSISLIFNLFSSLGLIYFYFALNLKRYNRIYSLILFLMFPSFMFWTSGVSKDSLILFPIGLMIFYLNNFEKNILKILIITLIAFLIRPYFGLIIYISIFLYYLVITLFFSRKRNGNLFFLIISSFFIFFISQYVLGNLSIKNIFNFINVIQSQYQDALLAIPEDKNFFIRIFSYFFGPSILNSKGNIFVLLLSFENLILFIFIFYLFINLEFKKLIANKENIFLLIFIIFAAIFFSQLSNNYGTAMRQKWMTLPFIFFILFSNQKALIFYRKKIKK